MEAKAGKRSPFSKFSWADEVEKEEKQETRDTVRDLLPRENLNWKLNPFGDARPREVVLEERAINWKTNDRELGQQSNLRRSIKSKENIPLVPSSTKRTEQKWAARKNHIMKNTSPLVPVIKHLPKNIVALSDIGCENLGYKRCPANCKITANFPLQVRHGFHSPYMVFIPSSKMNKVGEMKMSPHIEMTINGKDVGCTNAVKRGSSVRRKTFKQAKGFNSAKQELDCPWKGLLLEDDDKGGDLSNFWRFHTNTKVITRNMIQGGSNESFRRQAVVQ